MPNMSYCRFRNTKSDVLDCLDALRQNEDMGKEEAKAGKKMFIEFLDFCKEVGIIEDYSEEEVDFQFDQLDYGL